MREGIAPDIYRSIPCGRQFSLAENLGLNFVQRAEIVSIWQTSGHYRHRSEDNLSSSGTLETLAAAINSALDERAKVIRGSQDLRGD